MESQKVAFVGAGNMGSCLIGGLIADGYDANAILASRRSPQLLDQLAERFHIQTSTDNAAIAAQADVVVLAVKPQMLQEVALSLRDVIQERQPLVISIAAGVRASLIEDWLGGGVPIVRCMPNTAAMVRCAATALYANAQVDEAKHTMAESILRAVGVTVWVDDEAKLDVVTALSGSGPAYFFLMMECMQDSAQRLGLSQQEANLLTLQTALGAARLAMESSDEVAVLRDNVTSPGGTTEAALAVLEQGGVRDLFENALKQATQRAKTLSDQLANITNGDDE